MMLTSYQTMAMFHTAVSPVGLTRTLSHTRLGVRCVVAGEAGFLRADCLRLPSGHAHLDVWVIRATGEADVLTHRATTPLREAWDRGGAEPLFDALEAIYATTI